MKEIIKDKYCKKQDVQKPEVISRKTQVERYDYEINEKNGIKLIITSSCELKIRQLCNMFSSTEYSGFVFYTVKDMKDDFSEGIIEAFDFFPMDVGSSAFTGFEYTPDVMRYMMSKGIMGKCQYGILHSHHKMETNPSQVDINTLRSEGSERNHFLSIIVNNSGRYSAFFTRLVEKSVVSRVTEKYMSFNNVPKTVEVDKSTSRKYVEINKLKIMMAYPNAGEINDRVKELRKNESKKRVTGTLGGINSIFKDDGTRIARNMSTAIDLKKVDTNGFLAKRCRDYAKSIFTDEYNLTLDKAIALFDKCARKDGIELDPSEMFRHIQYLGHDVIITIMAILNEYVDSTYIVGDVIELMSVYFNIEIL